MTKITMGLKITSEELVRGIVKNPTLQCQEIVGDPDFTCVADCPLMEVADQVCPCVYKYLYFTPEHKVKWATEYLEELDKLKYLESLK
jgi:hypothetical protein